MPRICFKFSRPLVLISSGQETAVYSALLDHLQLGGTTEPLLKFRFAELTGEYGANVLARLSDLIGKGSIEAGAVALEKELAVRLGDISRTTALSKFEEACGAFVSKVKFMMMTNERLERVAAELPVERHRAMLDLKKGFEQLAQEDKRLRVRRGSRKVGLAYFFDAKPRAKLVGLVGAYPERGQVAFGWDGWTALGLSKSNA